MGVGVAVAAGHVATIAGKNVVIANDTAIQVACEVAPADFAALAARLINRSAGHDDVHVWVIIQAAGVGVQDGAEAQLTA